MRNSTEPVSITPLADNTFAWWKRTGENNGSTAFSFSRFLVPYLCDYEGFAIFMDGADMLTTGDLASLWALRDKRYAVQCVQHPAYVPSQEKMWNQSNPDYPRKNWSSVMIINCAKAKDLTPEMVASAPGSYLHQFKWADSVGELPPSWNYLVDQGERPDHVDCYHYTLGIPVLRRPKDLESDAAWWNEREATIYSMKPV
jgi:hypothetical protein